MTRDEVLQLARAAGFMTGQMDLADGSGTYPVAQSIGTGCLVELERFAALVARREREACRTVAWAQPGCDGPTLQRVCAAINERDALDAGFVPRPVIERFEPAKAD